MTMEEAVEYCTHITIREDLRLDLFADTIFRVRKSDLEGEPFPPQYEIPFAVGRTIPWETVKYEADDTSDSTMVAVRTAKLVIYVRKDNGNFMVETPEGKRLYPEAAPRYGMFKNHCIVFDAASFWGEESNCSRFSHWFYREETSLYDVLLKEDKLLDTFFIYGETYREGYRLFRELTGAEPMLLKKGYGSYQTQHLSAEGNQEIFMQTAELLRKRDIPCDTLILDFEWGDGADGGEEKPWGSRLDWSGEYSRPDAPGDMLAKLKDMHFDVMTIHHSVPAYEGRFDEDWVCAEYDDGLWWQKMQEQLDIGVVGTWQDTRQTDITNARIYAELQKRTKKRVSMLSNYDLYRNSGWTKDCVMTPKKQKIGGRRTPFYWTGDTAVTSWEDLAYQIQGIINEHGALKGISYLTNDGMRPGGRELGVRCEQFLCFNSVHRSHNCKPWEAPQNADALAERMAIDKERTMETEKRTAAELLGLDCPDIRQEEIVRKFLKIRYSLLPYLYSAARECYDTGLPITRPLMVSFEEDPNCRENQFPMQYMFGRDILMCPIWQEEKKMEVYLPAGCDWIGFFDGRRWNGGQKITADVSELSEMPVFVRSGAIIPIRKEKNWIDDEEDELVLKIFGTGEGECVLYEDDGITCGYQRGECSFTRITSRSTEEEAAVVIEPVRGEYAGMKKERSVTVERNGKTVSIRQDKTQKAVMFLK